MSETLSTPGAGPTSGRRAWIAIATTLVVLTAATIAGLLSSADGGAPVILVERISSQIGLLASGAASRLWWTYAFLLGVVAAFNPCGFGLVPAYVGLYLNNDTTRGSLAARARRALVVSTVVAAAFTLLFGVTGALISAGSTLISSLIVGLLPWVGLGVGVILVIFGGVILSGKSFGFVAAQRVASRFGRTASGSGTRGYAAFGLAYGLASLGCTLPLFLALLGTASAAGGPGSAIVAFALYGLGMGTTLSALTLVAAIAGVGILSRLRGMGWFVPGLGAALLLASGAYVVYYWLSAGRLLLT
jgi:cytochrome c-type biogenesis protein